MSQVLLTAGQIIGAPWNVMTLTDDVDQLQSGTGGKNMTFQPRCNIRNTDSSVSLRFTNAVYELHIELCSEMFT